MKANFINSDSPDTIWDIPTPDPSFPPIFQLVVSYCRPITLLHPVAKSKNEVIYSSVRPLTITESEIDNRNISDQRLAVASPKMPSDTSEVNSCSVE